MWEIWRSQVSLDDEGADKRYESGARVAEVLLYRSEEFPRGLIGPGEILWQTPVEGQMTRRLWLRLHPSIFNDILNILGLIVRKWNVEMRDLRGEIDGFEIMGPMAGKILRRCLKICRSESEGKRDVSFRTIYLISGLIAVNSVLRKFGPGRWTNGDARRYGSRITSTRS
jgi:hypothetical protein